MVLESFLADISTGAAYRCIYGQEKESSLAIAAISGWKASTSLQVHQFVADTAARVRISPWLDIEGDVLGHFSEGLQHAFTRFGTSFKEKETCLISIALRL